MSSEPLSNREALASLLRWYAEIGIDLAIDEEPHDRFAEAAAAQARAVTAQAPEESKPPRVSPPLRRPDSQAPYRKEPQAGSQPATTPFADLIGQSAREAAATAQTLDELRERLAAFTGCALRETATQLVFSDGNPEADTMLVGEAPGADEDRIGKPFVGKAGQLLDKMLAAIGLDREKVYIANVVPWRPPGNRTPTPVETAACLPFTRRQIELVNPKMLICLGAPSAQTLLGIKDGIMRARGKWLTYDIAPDRTIPALAMLHPAYLLRQPAQKKYAWQDLRLIAKELEKSG